MAYDPVEQAKQRLADGEDPESVKSFMRHQGYREDAAEDLVKKAQGPSKRDVTHIFSSWLGTLLVIVLAAAAFATALWMFAPSLFSGLPVP